MNIINTMDKIVILIIGFLTFSVQLLATKSLLGNFGGSASVWIGSLMFFQLGLFISYSLTHYWINSVHRYLKLGVLALITNLLFLFKVIPLPSIEGSSQIINLTNLCLELFLNYGLLFISLLTISPIIQKTSTKPYQLYVFSNLGAFLGLLSYPFLIEPFLGIKNQNYFFIILSFMVFLWSISRIKSQNFKENFSEHLPSIVRNKTIFWSALGTMILGAFSGYLIQDLISFPLLWVLPLSLYLASFVWSFSSFNKEIILKNQRNLLEILIIIVLAGMELENPWASLSLEILSFSLIILITNLNLSKQAPKNSTNLTSFYFFVALGGLLGGLIVNLIIPLWFTKVNEYIFFLIVLMVAIHFSSHKLRKTQHLSFIILVIIAITWQVYQNSLVIDSRRSFYGLIQIKESQDRRMMFHGSIIHGEENLKDPNEPTSYYQKPMVENLFINNPQSIALVGLGAGVLLKYPNKDSQIDVFEIDSTIFDLAQKHFSFIKKTTAKINYFFIDGRKGLENSSKKYDLIIIDAFSGDSIPSHLLTVEAFKIYKEHLSANGKIGIHISNRYLNLLPIVTNTAGKVQLKTTEKFTTIKEYKARWVLLENDENPSTKLDSRFIWTDDFSSLWNILKK